MNAVEKERKVLVSITSGNKKSTKFVNGLLLPNGHTIVSESVIESMLEDMKVKRGENYSVS